MRLFRRCKCCEEALLTEKEQEEFICQECKDKLVVTDAIKLLTKLSKGLEINGIWPFVGMS